MKQSILSDHTTNNNINNKNRHNKKTSASALLLNCGKKSAHRRKKSRKISKIQILSMNRFKNCYVNIFFLLFRYKYWFNR